MRPFRFWEQRGHLAEGVLQPGFRAGQRGKSQHTQALHALRIQVSARVSASRFAALNWQGIPRRHPSIRNARPSAHREEGEEMPFSVAAVQAVQMHGDLEAVKTCENPLEFVEREHSIMP